MNHLIDGLLTLSVLAAAVVILITVAPPASGPGQDAADIRTHLLSADGAYGSLRADIAVATVTNLQVDDDRITATSVNAPIVLPPSVEVHCELTDVPIGLVASRQWGDHEGPSTSVAVMQIPLPARAPEIASKPATRDALESVYAALPRPLPSVRCVVSTAR